MISMIFSAEPSVHSWTALRLNERFTKAGQRFADQWSDLLRGCAAGSGLQWRGDLQNGAAWPVGAPAGDPLAALSGCVVAGIK